MLNASRTKTIGFIFLAIGFVYVIFLVNAAVTQKKHDSVEKFQNELDDTDSKPNGSVDGTDQYKSRLYVIKVFDALFNRKPTTEELGRYGSFGTDKQIMGAILNDYDILEHANVDGDTLEAQTKLSGKNAAGFDKYENVHAEIESDDQGEEGNEKEEAVPPTKKSYAVSEKTAAKALDHLKDNVSGPAVVKSVKMNEIINRIENDLAELKLLV